MSTLNLTLRMCDDNTTASFSIGSTDQLWPVFEDYSKNIGKNMNALFFKFDGQLIYPYMTAAQLEMEDGDIIDVFNSQASAHTKRGRSNSPEDLGGKR